MKVKIYLCNICKDQFPNDGFCKPIGLNKITDNADICDRCLKMIEEYLKTRGEKNE